jgi:hypothetical protein
VVVREKPLTDEELDKMLSGFTKEINSDHLERLVAEVRWLRANTKVVAVDLEVEEMPRRLRVIVKEVRKRVIYEGRDFEEATLVQGEAMAALLANLT